MKKVLSCLLILFILVFTANVSDAISFKKKTEKTQKTEKSYISNLYSVSKFFADYEYYANNYNTDEYLKLYDKNYISCDGFNLDIITKLVKETWELYPGIKYKVKVNGATFYENLAIVDVTETAKGYTKTNDGKTTEFMSTIQSVYQLKPVNKSWIIVSDYTVHENIYLSWGDIPNADIKLEIPKQLLAGQEYTAQLKIKRQEGIVPIGSIIADKVTYPQKPSKEIYRKFSADGVLERIMKTNTDNVNEFIVATVGFTKPTLDDNKNLNIQLIGYKCIMERMNVIPKNKFIEVKNDKKPSE